MAWPAVAGALLGAGLGVAGNVGSAKMSQDLAREQMDFQERMSSTAYQRSADDLEAAGLNRILALGSPASTPGGAMGQVPDMGGSIIQGSQQISNLKTQKSQREQLSASADAQGASAKQTAQQTRLLKMLADRLEKGDDTIDDLVEGAKGIFSIENPAQTAEAITNLKFSGQKGSTGGERAIFRAKALLDMLKGIGVSAPTLKGIERLLKIKTGGGGW